MCRWLPGRVYAPLVLTLLACAVLPAAARAQSGLDDVSDQWLPRSDNADWVYAWSDSEFQPSPHREHYTVQARAGRSFRLKWEEIDAPDGTTPSAGTIDFQETDSGLLNLNYQSTQPPPQFPILCPSATNCGNSLAGSLYMLIWGTRSPVLAEPLLHGTRWSSTGGAANDVVSDNRYIGHRMVKVPAFPNRVAAAKVVSRVTQAGALGDPYGTGVRTVYWVRGVGPVRIVFRHAGGQVSRANLESTSLQPLPLPPDANLLPLDNGHHAKFRWRNSRYMRHWSRQRFDVKQSVNGTSTVTVKHLSGPINVAGGYSFTTRLSGITQLVAATKAATRAKFPRLGPRHAPRDSRRHFFTPYDLMVYGFDPVVPVYPHKGETWRGSRDGRDWTVFGVTGVSKVIAMHRRVRTPAGRFRAVVIRSKLRQAGFRFGSGTRKSWFVPGKGLVKLVFRHADGSVSTVERIK